MTIKTMDSSLYHYILKHSRKDQILLIMLSLISLPLVYITLELPKMIINVLEGKEIPQELFGYSLNQLNFLMVLSFAFLLTVFASGAIKYVLNVYRGTVGERLLRRLRYELYVHLLRFPVPRFKRVSSGELVPMITAETEPLAEFIGESYTLPVFQGGILFTYLLFIFQQDVFLGLAAISLYPFQLYVIPKLQKRVNELSKKRVAEVRSLSGRIGETVAGINEVHSNDTTHFERSHISKRLGRIFSIRVSIYQRKFFIKFLNNFIAQLTPFFFYSVGGYFVLRGDLSIGAMVAVLVAYKDLSGPWKELLRYYQRKEDIKVKYNQVIEQFTPSELLDATLIDSDAESVKLPSGNMQANNISYTEDGLYYSVESASFNLPMDQHIATVGLSNSGKDELARIIARLIHPTEGSISIGDQNLSKIPEVLTGSKLAYVGPNCFMFSGTIRDNLVYPLKHKPSEELAIDEEYAAKRKHRNQLAEQAGNSVYDPDDQWIDLQSIGIQQAQQFDSKVQDILKLVEIDDEVYQYGLLSKVDKEQHPKLVQRIMLARTELHDTLQNKKYVKLVEPFDKEKYNSNLSVSENLLFGTIYDEELNTEKLSENKYLTKVLKQSGLYDDLIEAGKQFAEIILDLFADVEPDSELFKQFSSIKADDLPEFQQILLRIKKQQTQEISAEDRSRLLSQAFKLTISRHRLGLIDESIQQRILVARKTIQDQALDNGIGIEFFDEADYNSRVSIQDNILFGKLSYGQANAQEKINQLISNVIEEHALYEQIIECGLDYEVGVGGARLSGMQRQKIGLARSIIKSPDLLIVNEALAALDTPAERRLIRKIRKHMPDKGIFWVLARPQLVEEFESVFVMERGKLTDIGPYEQLKDSSQTLKLLLSED